MINVLRGFGKAILAACLIYPQLSYADDFTSADVLEWSKEAQNSMFQTSVGMMAVVATQLEDRAQLAECIDKWYFETEGVTAERNEEIRQALQRFPDYHPQAMVMAVVVKSCGEF